MASDEFMQQTRAQLEHTQVWVRAVEYVVKQVLAGDEDLRERVRRTAAADERLTASVKAAIADIVAGVPER